MAARKDNKAKAASGARNWTKEPYRSQLLEAIRVHNGNLNRCALDLRTSRTKQLW